MSDKHEFILVLFLLLAALVAIVFVYVYLSSGAKSSQKEDGKGLNNTQRFWFFLLLTAALFIFASFTIPKSPYYLFEKESPSRVVFVAAQQYYWALSSEAIGPGNPGAGEAIELKRGELVEFRVTSLDVNHGFGIYDESNNLIAQTQAMPGYVNRLRWKFEKPGTYKVLCLEFCGLAHAVMRASFTVR
ncbi:MAG: cytochrome c oxidase subunit II [Candidatus Dadabacteria bacterium]|nr:cytochrome c oxidase subunit II [Candidatus Dadabacteria bacterium]